MDPLTWAGGSKQPAEDGAEEALVLAAPAQLWKALVFGTGDSGQGLEPVSTPRVQDPSASARGGPGNGTWMQRGSIELPLGSLGLCCGLGIHFSFLTYWDP